MGQVTVDRKLRQYKQLLFKTLAVNHTFACVIAVYREVWVCYIISTHARAIVTTNSVVAD